MNKLEMRVTAVCLVFTFDTYEAEALASGDLFGWSNLTTVRHSPTPLNPQSKNVVLMPNKTIGHLHEFHQRQKTDANPETRLTADIRQ